MPIEGDGGKEAVAILLELDRIETLAARPQVKPKRKLEQCGRSAARIRELLFKGATKQILAEGGYVPQGKPPKEGV